MSSRAPGAVVVDTMAVSALVNATRNSQRAAAYRRAINGDAIVVSFVTITELRFGALRAGWGDLRRRGLERDFAKLVVVQPDDQLMQTCAGTPRLVPASRTRTRPQGSRSRSVDRSSSSPSFRGPRFQRHRIP